MTKSRATRTAEVELTTEGIAIVRIRPKVTQSIEDARENIQVAIELGGKLCPLLSDIRIAETLDAETRHFYSGKRLTDSFSALAILVRGGSFGTMMGNVYIRIARPGIPFKLFNSEAQAIKWLQGFLQ